jgi:hypothetical protein
MDTAPYYAPAYFAPSYFDGENGSASSPSSNGVTPYDAPTYFPPSYFYGEVAPTSVIVPITPFPGGRDSAAYSALLSLIEATGAFQDVIFGATTQRSEAGADSYPLAVVTPKGWEEDDDFDPISIVRRVSFAITIVVKSQDGCSEFDQLDCLSSIVLGVVDRSDLGGTCLAPLTRIRAGRYESSTRYPEQSVDLNGEFCSLIDPFALNSALS